MTNTRIRQSVSYRNSGEYRDRGVRERRTLRNRYDEGFVDGNVVRKTAPKRERKHNLKITRSGVNAKSDNKETVLYGIFIAFAISVCVIICSLYINIKSDMENDLKRIGELSKEYEVLKADNDDFESRISGNVDLEDIKRKAMKDLHMQYAGDNQIIRYKSDDTDYVRQYISLE